MKTAAIAALASALLAVPSAYAQATNCKWIGQIWTCNQGQPQTQLDPNIILQAGNINDPAWLARQREAQLDAQRAQQQMQQQAQARAYAEQSQRLRQYVGRRLASGDCQGAQSAALQAGDIELAKQVQGYCAAQPSK
ncbi:MAG TPA: hypothetical protein VN222_06820 [Novosphingobium sp.]|nr:hypothetical protein [Novosphingobium sp.]